MQNNQKNQTKALENLPAHSLGKPAQAFIVGTSGQAEEEMTVGQADQELGEETEKAIAPAPHRKPK